MNDRIQSIYYFAAFNVIFVASRDGKYQCWKFPDAWRDELIEKKEKEFLIERKIARMTISSKPSITSASKEETKKG